MPGMVAVWRWQNWAEEACCSLLDSRMVSTAHVCSALSGLFVACWFFTSPCDFSVACREYNQASALTA